MTLKEKILFSSEKIRFTLYKEGLFYKCYNELACIKLIEWTQLAVVV